MEANKPEGAWSSTELLQNVERGIADQRTRPARGSWTRPGLTSRRRGPIVAVGVAVVILVPVVTLMLMVRGTSDSDVATTPAPTTVVAPIVTDVSAVPFYARFPEGEIIHDDEWAVVVFHRPPSCIPPLANLLEVADQSVVGRCGPPTISGTATWNDGPQVDAQPTETTYAGLGEVPVWLAPWPLIEQLAADGALSRREMLDIHTRIEATATSYVERSGSGVLDIAGSGQLADGRPFSFSASHGDGETAASIELPFALEPVTTQSLVGEWASEFEHIEFFEDGTLWISYIRVSAYGSLRPKSAELLPSGVTGVAFGEGSYRLSAGLVTMIEGDSGLCPGVPLPGTYFAQIGEDGMLTLDIVDDECGRTGHAPLSPVG